MADDDDLALPELSELGISDSEALSSRRPAAGEGDEPTPRGKKELSTVKPTAAKPAAASTTLAVPAPAKSSGFAAKESADGEATKPPAVSTPVKASLAAKAPSSALAPLAPLSAAKPGGGMKGLAPLTPLKAPSSVHAPPPAVTAVPASTATPPASSPAESAVASVSATSPPTPSKSASATPSGSATSTSAAPAKLSSSSSSSSLPKAVTFAEAPRPKLGSSASSSTLPTAASADVAAKPPASTSKPATATAAPKSTTPPPPPSSPPAATSTPSPTAAASPAKPAPSVVSAPPSPQPGAAPDSAASSPTAAKRKDASENTEAAKPTEAKSAEAAIEPTPAMPGDATPACSATARPSSARPKPVSPPSPAPAASDAAADCPATPARAESTSPSAATASSSSSSFTSFAAAANVTSPLPSAPAPAVSTAAESPDPPPTTAISSKPSSASTNASTSSTSAASSSSDAPASAVAPKQKLAAVRPSSASKPAAASSSSSSSSAASAASASAAAAPASSSRATAAARRSSASSSRDNSPPSRTRASRTAGMSSRDHSPPSRNRREQLQQQQQQQRPVERAHTRPRDIQTSAVPRTASSLRPSPTQRPVAVAVRHRHAAAHAALPPATSSQHESWEDELEAELADYSESPHPAAAVHPDLAVSTSMSSFDQNGVAIGPLPSPLASPPSAQLRPPSPDSNNEQSFSPVNGGGGGARRSPSGSPSSASAAAAASSAEHVSSVQPLRLHAPSRLNVSPAFIEPVTGESCLTVFTGTWNLHAKPFPSNLSDFIPPPHIGLGSAPASGAAGPVKPAHIGLGADLEHHHKHVGGYDIYVLGTEECENSIEASMIFSSKAKWSAAVTALLGDSYVEVAQQTLQAIHIIAFVRRSIFPHVHHIEHGCVATGIGDIVGNKGGVAIGFDISNTSFLFVNAHLAAHQHAVAQRNADAFKVLSRLALKEKVLLRNPHLSLVSDRFERVWFMGDLNYRVEGNRRMIDALVRQRMIEVLLANDQLNMVRAAAFSASASKASSQQQQQQQQDPAAGVWKGFIEGDIHFLPTYKFDRNSDTYDSSKKRRIPSYTDRILWKASSAIELMEYASVESVKSSDHRPVYATFKVKVTQRAANDAAKLKKLVLGTNNGSKACSIQ